MADTALPHEQVWDDTDLVDSWNEAFAEYQKYHSIAAKGGKIGLEPSPDRDVQTNGDAATATATAQDVPDEAAGSDDYAPSVGQASKSGQSAPAIEPSFAASTAAALPQALAGNVQDETMKNLMMSWYYAGYYTGLYEGKQQGYASALQQQKQGG